LLIEEKDVFTLNKIDQTIEFAAKAHFTQFRKGTDIPYISHPFGVGLILQKAGCKEELIIAGILHDTLEDTDTTEKDLEDKFGKKVLDIVKGCSEPDKTLSWEERKKHTIDYLKTASLSIRQVACADKLHNLRSIKRDLKDVGEEAWVRFKRGRSSQEWYYTEIVESLGYKSRFRLLDLLQDEVEELFGSPLENSEWKKLRGSKEFFDLAFESAYGMPKDNSEWYSRMEKIGGLELVKQVHSLCYPIAGTFGDEFNQVANYLQARGIQFQSNSDGPIILIGFSAVLKKLLNLYPHEIYHHFYRNLKRGIL
jgi:hypothetical protein